MPLGPRFNPALERRRVTNHPGQHLDFRLDFLPTGAVDWFRDPKHSQRLRNVDVQRVVGEDATWTHAASESKHVRIGVWFGNVSVYRQEAFRVERYGVVVRLGVVCEVPFFAIDSNQFPRSRSHWRNHEGGWA